MIVVDFHAEATSEKVAMAHYLDGRVTAVLGTHTHVQTNDARVLAGGTAAITDAGMTGPHDSVIGSVPEGAIRRFITGMPVAARGRRPATCGSRACSSSAAPTAGRPAASSSASRRPGLDAGTGRRVRLVLDATAPRRERESSANATNGKNHCR